MGFRGFLELFGKKKSKAAGVEDSIQSLRNTEELLNKKSEYLEKLIKDACAKAKELGTKNKTAALKVLAQKKRYEEQLRQLDGTLTTVQFQREALESASTNKEVLNAMQQAAKTQKANFINTDTVHQILDEVHEQQELAQEVTNALSTPIGQGCGADEDELMAELEQLEQEDLDKKPTAVDNNLLELPNVPETLPKTEKKEKEKEEIKQLEAWAS